MLNNAEYGERKSKKRFIGLLMSVIMIMMVFGLSACGGSSETDGEVSSEADDEALIEIAGDESDDSDGEDLNEADEEDLSETYASNEPDIIFEPFAIYDLSMVEDGPWQDRYEAEDAVLTGNDIFTQDDSVSEFSGSGFVGLFTEGNYDATFTIDVPAEGFYNLYIAAMGIGGDKPVQVIVNGESKGEALAQGSNRGSTFAERSIQVLFDEGENIVTIAPGWTWFFLDYIRIDRPEQDLLGLVMDFDRELSNPNANAETKNVWSFIVDNYGTKVISGHCINNDVAEYVKEMAYFSDTVGIMPAMMVFEMFDYDYAAVSNGVVSGAVERAIKWGKDEGGIVGFHWHWHMGAEYLAPNKPWWASFYSDEMSSTFQDEFANAMETMSGDLYDYIIRDIDLIAEQLKKLQDNGVPVLWRPLHEASGTWFWWGGSGPEACVKLWKLMYERMTDYHNLNNLIWIWNSIGDGWFPGAEYVDMVSADVGARDFEHESYSVLFYNKAKELIQEDTMKMLALTETGPIPDIDKMVQDRSLWSFWATWVGVPRSTTVEMMTDTLNHPRVITLKNLPKW